MCATTPAPSVEVSPPDRQDESVLDRVDPHLRAEAGGCVVHEESAALHDPDAGAEAFNQVHLVR